MAEFIIQVSVRFWLRPVLYVWRFISWPLPAARRKAVAKWLCRRGMIITNGSGQRGGN